jgi:hypothetical protein
LKLGLSIFLIFCLISCGETTPKTSLTLSCIQQHFLFGGKESTYTIKIHKGKEIADIIYGSNVSNVLANIKANDTAYILTWDDSAARHEIKIYKNFWSLSRSYNAISWEEALNMSGKCKLIPEKNA